MISYFQKQRWKIDISQQTSAKRFAENAPFNNSSPQQVYLEINSTNSNVSFTEHQRRTSDNSQQISAQFAINVI